MFNRLAGSLLVLFVFCASVPSRAADEQLSSYKTWSSQKPGTAVKYKVVFTVGAKTTTYVLIYTLKEVTAEQVTLQQSHVRDGEKAEILDVSFKIRPGDGGVAGRNPDVKEINESKETVKIAGKSYKCKLTEVKTDWNKRTMTDKRWTSSDVPGTLVKEEADAVEDGISTKQRIELLEIVEK